MRGQARAFDREGDAQLVRQAQGGSAVAFQALAGRWNRRLIAHAWRLLGDQEAACDAAQAAWVEIARGLTRLRDPVAFPAWAFRITTRQAATLIRQRQADRRLARVLEQAAASEPSAISPTSSEFVASTALHAAIRRLSPAQRAALALHHFEDLTVAEVAVALDTPVGTIKTRLMYARLKLKAALEGETHD